MKRRWQIAEEWSDRLARAGLSDLHRLLTDPFPPPDLSGQWEPLTKPGLGGRQRWRWKPDGPVSESNAALTASTLQSKGPPTTHVLYLKRYRSTSWNAQLDRIRRQSARHSRAWWEYQQSVELGRQSIPAARTVAVVEEMRGVFERSSALLLEAATGEALDRAWCRLRQQNAPILRGLARHDLVRRLARFISAFHQTGACHRDLYLCHVFADLDPAGRRPPAFTLIDLARLWRPRWWRTRWLIKDLSQLDSSARQIGLWRTDRLRFLLTYLGLDVNAPRVRWYARRIVRKSDAILRRIRRKGGLAGSEPKPAAAGQTG